MRQQGLTEAFLSNADTLLKSAAGEIKSVTITNRGGVAGDQVVFRDGLDGLGTPLVVFVFASANETQRKEWPDGKRFNTGLFYDTEATGLVQGEITFK